METHLTPPISATSSFMDPKSQDLNSPPSPKLQLYSYWQSSCSWRVRFALNLKGIAYEYKAVDLSRGEQFNPEFERLNPIGFVPVLVDGDVVVSDSFAILLYLEERFPEIPLLPSDLKRKAVNLQAASIISSSIQPLQMLSVLKYIEEHVSAEEKIVWGQHHVTKGFTSLEKLLKDFAGTYATGNEVYLADVFLAPQIGFARTRFNVDMSKFPTLDRIFEACKILPAFQASLPEATRCYDFEGKLIGVHRCRSVAPSNILALISEKIFVQISNRTEQEAQQLYQSSC